MKKALILIGFLLILSSCEKEEEKLPGKFSSGRIGISDLVSQNGIDYLKQSYFDLSTHQNKASNDRDAWDIAFSCDPANPNIFVNPAMLMRVAHTGQFDFSLPINTSNYQDQLEYERAAHYFQKGFMQTDFEINGSVKGEVFLIDLGLNLQNKARGFKLLQLLDFDGSSYTLQLSDTDNNNPQQFIVNLNGTYNNLYISFTDVSNTLTLEPPKEDWDLLFTKYMERLFDGVDTVDYSVTGCLINPYKTKAYLNEESRKDTTISFYSLTADDIDESEFSSHLNTVGHDWKFFDLSGSSRFLIVPHRHYFIKDNNETNYRLQFTGFYSELGNKGAVSFEYLDL